MKAWLKGGLIAELLLLIFFIILIPISGGWVIFLIPAFLVGAIPLFLVGAFFGSLSFKKTKKDSAYHKKWMIWTASIVVLIYLLRFIFVFKDIKDWSILNILALPIGLLNNMNLILFYPLIACTLIFIIATVLFIVSKRKENDKTNNRLR